MKQKIIFSIPLLSAFCAVCGNLMADDLASPNQVKPLVQFSPPPLITPQNALSSKLENQFDNSERNFYHSVTNTLDSAMNPFHFASGFFGRSNYTSLLAKFRDSQVYGNLVAHYSYANPYTDGYGDKVDFGYKRKGASVILGAVPNAFNELKATFIYDNITDDKQPHYQMDPVNTTRFVGKIDYRLGKDDLSNTMNLGAFYRNVSRRANNFDLRENNGTARMKMEVDRHIFDFSAIYDYKGGESSVDSNTKGESKSGESKFLHNSFGLIYTLDSHTAKRFASQNYGAFNHNGYRIPNAFVNQISAFDTLTLTPDSLNKIALGIHYDYNIADLKDKNVVVGTQNGNNQQITANNMWFAHYGKRVGGGLIQSHAVSASFNYDIRPSDSQLYTLNISTLERIPSNDERFVAVNPPGQNAHAQAWVSNPFLKPERRNRAKLSAEIASDSYINYMESRFDENAFKFGFSVVADYANRFIIYDRFTNSNNTDYQKHIISRNVDAFLLSANANFVYNFLGLFGVKLNLWYAYGQNLSDKRALYQIRPFEAQLNFDYEDYAPFGKYNIGAGFRSVAKQNRYDTILGIDAPKSGFVVLDLYAGFSIMDKLGIRLGVDNVLDKGYSEFISASHVESLSPTNIINAPGRTFYVSIHGNF